MRILLIHSFYRRGLPSGENDVVLEQLRILGSAGYEVALWDPTSTDQPSTFEKAKIGISVLRGSGRDPLQMISDFQPDLLHIHNLFPQIGTKWLHKTHIPKALSLHNYRIACTSGVLFRDGVRCFDCIHGSRFHAVQHKCYQNSALATLSVISHQQRLRFALANVVDLVIYTSEFSQRILVPFVQAKTSTVLPNYVAPVHSVPESQAGPSDAFFVTVSRLSEEKGLPQLLRMWPDDMHLTVVGEGPQRAALERLTEGKFINFTGFLPNTERDFLLSQASALILPSVTPEVDGLVVAQALSAGTPSIVAHGTASAALASDCRALKVFDDAESLAKALDLVLAEDGLPEIAKTMYRSRWSRETWLKGYRERVLRPLSAS